MASIAEVSEKYGLSADTLRYYERIGLIPPVPRTSGGIRNYGEKECGWIEFVKCMRAAGLPVEMLIDYIQLFRQGEDTAAARRDLLAEQRDLLIERIAEMQKTLEKLNYKIDVFYGKALEQQNKRQRFESKLK